MRFVDRRVLFVLSLLVLGAGVETAVSAEREFRPPSPQLLASPGFLRSHPDIRWRLRGQEEYERGNMVAAVDYFRRSSRYADKLSQAMTAELLWQGAGIPQDQVAAQAWMDLAAERGYTVFARWRDHMWEKLDDEQRVRAVQLRAQLEAEFGDLVAKRRLEFVLTRGLREATGSRVGGSTGRVWVVGSTKSAYSRCASSEVELKPGGGDWDFYSAHYWRPNLYWQMQDQIAYRMAEGEVIVHPLQPQNRDGGD